MGQRYKSVSEMINNTASSEAFKAKALKEINKKTIAKFLFSLRCQHNLTQSKLAKNVKCSQGRISKIESSYDDEISIKDLLDYGKALNLQLEIGYRNNSTKIVDLIKYHAFRIKRYLNELTLIAGDDEALNKAIDNFHKEVFVNMAKIISDSAVKLRRVYEKREHIHISPPLSKEKLEDARMKSLSV